MPSQVVIQGKDHFTMDRKMVQGPRVPLTHCPTGGAAPTQHIVAPLNHRRPKSAAQCMSSREGGNPTHGPPQCDVTMQQGCRANPTRTQHLDFKEDILMTTAARVATYTFGRIQPRQLSAPERMSPGAFATI